VLEWAALTDAFLPDDLRALERMRAGDASAAARALARLRAMREAVYDVVIAAIRHKPVPEDAMGRLTRHWKSSVAAAQLTFSAGRASLQFNIADSRLEYPRHVLAASAFDLLQTLPLQRTRECADPRCTWIFIDHSRGGQRRWCNMATCGNQAKSRRHHQRKRAAP
jgi:predicted RNA-binding Zn ribbon-like protein